MNYYIQGDAANADKIRAAFEKLGIDVLDFGFADKTVLYCSIGGCVQYLPYSINLMHILYCHPDYKELELPVESMFNVGDWVVFNNSHNSIYQISEIRDSYYKLTHTHGGSMPLSFLQEELLRPWTIEDAKDGDVLVTTKVRSSPFIYRKTDYNNNLAYYYAGIDGNGNFREGCLKRTLYHFGSVENVVPATKEQRGLLFAKMKEAGYVWDEKKKELKKIQSHYDIKNFKPFDKVLVRDSDSLKWVADLFSYIDDGFVCTGGIPCRQCIPFEGNEHLLGTTNMCDEQYINW